MDPFLGQISTFAISFAPSGWALCNGAILPIAQNPALFSLLGNVFGGDGKTTFALPDLRGRTPISTGINPASRITYQTGNSGGAEAVTLTTTTIPPHMHTVTASTGNDVNGNTYGPTNAGFGTVLSDPNNPSASAFPIYAPPSTSPQPLDPASVLPSGGSLPHPNLQPFLAINFCIATTGTYPMRP